MILNLTFVMLSTSMEEFCLLLPTKLLMRSMMKWWLEKRIPGDLDTFHSIDSVRNLDNATMSPTEF